MTGDGAPPDPGRNARNKSALVFVAALLILTVLAAIGIANGIYAELFIIPMAACFAVLYYCKESILCFAIPVVLVIAIMIFPEILIDTLLTLNAYAIIGAIIAIMFSHEFSRAGITLSAAIAAAVCYFIAFMEYVNDVAGEISLPAISAVIDVELQAASGILSEAYTVYFESAGVAITEAQVSSYVQEILINTKLILPSMFVIAMSVLAYIITSLFRFVYNIGTPASFKKIEKDAWRLKTSVATAVVYMILIISQLFLNGEESKLPLIVVTNMLYILSPVMALSGWYYLYDKFRAGSGGRKAVYIVVFVLSVFVLGTLVLAIIAVFGIYSVIIVNIRSFRERMNNKLFDGEGEHKDDEKEGFFAWLKRIFGSHDDDD
ncbi:hypothetical protein FACS1894105_12840 [Clostridia bacterium]|nr:hypothetical protein FACS1894105_12840 [Clostridia bacterium]